MPDEFIDLEYDNQRVEASRGVLELAVRQLRAFARCVTGNRAKADALVEDTLMLFLAEDRILNECETCFADLVDVFRRVNAGISPLATASPLPDADYTALLRLPVAEREAIALIDGAGLAPAQAADILGIPELDAVQLMANAKAQLGDRPLPDWPLITGFGAGASGGRGAA